MAHSNSDDVPGVTRHADRAHPAGTAPSGQPYPSPSPDPNAAPGAAPREDVGHGWGKSK